MPTKMIFPRCSVSAIITIVSNAFVDRINVSLKISLLCCFVITLWTGIPVHTVNFTYMLEQVSFLVGCKITLIALEFFVSVNVLNVCF